MQEIRELVSMGFGYVLFSVAALAIIAVLFFIGYFLVYRKLLKGGKKIKLTDLVKWGLLLSYIIVILSLTLDRGVFYNYESNIKPPFYSYIEAWNTFNFTLWRNIILNIVAFIPFGFLVPLTIKRCRSFLKTLAVSILFTVMIELVQLVTGVGIFEFDDVVGNTVGSMIGYGIFGVAICLYSKPFGVKPDWKRLVALQIPLICTIMAFSSVFAAYSIKELGNLRYYVDKTPKSSFSLMQDDNVDLSVQCKDLMVYKIKVYSHSQVEEYAKKLLSNVGDSIDESRTMFYEETAFFWGKGSSCYKINYNGGEVEYTNFDYLDKSVNSNASEKEVVRALAQIGITLPENTTFCNDGNGWYSFECADISEDYLYSGSIRLQMRGDSIAEYYNEILELEPYKKHSSISEMEAYMNIADGKFYHSPYFSEFNEIVINDVSIGYDKDTKGFYQPVYVFDVLDNGEATTIKIPALK